MGGQVAMFLKDDIRGGVSEGTRVIEDGFWRPGRKREEMDG